MSVNRIWHWVFSVISFLSIGIAGVAVSGQVASGVARPVQADIAEFSAITEFESRIEKVNFKAGDRHHMLRKSRIDYYIDLARNSARQGWGYQEQDAIRRAKLILAHHVSKGLNDNAPG